jgi:hypothetical protein
MTKPQLKVERLKKKLADLGPMLPGSISEQWNVCGTPGCRCKDPQKPKKHGPYYQLSFTVAGKSSSMFIKKANLLEIRRRIKRYQQFKLLTKNLLQAHIELVRAEGFDRSAS